MKELPSLRAIGLVWLRYFDVFRKNLLYGVVSTFVEPLLFLVAFGYGLGSLIPELQVGSRTVSYREFILAGVAAQAVLFQAFFDGAYGSFIRMYYQRIFKAMAVTPITLSEVLWGELLWDASKATFSAGVVLLVGGVIGDFSWWGVLVSLPLCFLGGLVFAGLGLWMAALSPNIEALTYPQNLVVFPMFLFCGVYFPLETLPDPLPAVAWIFPLTALASLLRSFTLDFPFAPFAVVNLLIWMIVLIGVSRSTMLRRLVK